MNLEEANYLLENTDDKLSVFANNSIWDFDTVQIALLAGKFLNDSEKIKLFNYPHFENADNELKSMITELIIDPNVLLQALYNEKVTKGLSELDLCVLTENLNDNGRMQILNDDAFIQRHKLKGNYYLYIVSELKDENIINLAIENHKLNKLDKILILSKLSPEALTDFLSTNTYFLKENNIDPLEIVINLNSDSQKIFVQNLEKTNLTLKEKKRILAMLKSDVKQSISIDNLPKEYQTALSMTTDKTNGENHIVLDLDRKVEDYRGLEDLIIVVPDNFNEEQREKFKKFCEAYPDLKVKNVMECKGEKFTFSSNGRDYVEAEKWIDSVLGKIKPEYTDVQKLAIIDNEIGKKITYSPDYETEVFDLNNNRALWKVISNGVGVCNGISRIEQYMLKRVGIESQIVVSKKHAFLKIKNIEMPLSDGTTVRGDTIIDSTWNLFAGRFGAMPPIFCVDYEQARKIDIEADGKDSESHKNDDEFQEKTLRIENSELGKIFFSVGLCDRYGDFPIKDLVVGSKQFHDRFSNNPELDINKQFLILEANYPDFAKYQDETSFIISDVLLSDERLRFNESYIGRVFDRNDEEKKPVLSVYVDFDGSNKKFWYADEKRGSFIELTQEEFERRFDCYEKDLEEYQGAKPWEKDCGKKENSARIERDVSDQGEDR